MNKYIRASYCVPCGFLKMMILKIQGRKQFSGPIISMISPITEITLDRGGILRIGNKFKMRDSAKLRVRNKAECIIGNNVSLNCQNMIACREKIVIGNDVQFSPNVQIYDHDHDYKTLGGSKAGKYKTSPVVIGNNVWIGANTVILRGTVLGDNCVVGAGSIIKGHYPDNSLIIQKRDETVLTEER